MSKCAWIWKGELTKPNSCQFAAISVRDGQPRWKTWNGFGFTSRGQASTSIIAVIPVVGAGLLGIVPLSELTGLECGLSCAFMVIAMLLRIDHYTAGYLSHEGHVHAT